MNTPLVLLLGGYGGAGQPIARLLLKHTDTQLIIAGRNADRATGFAAELNSEFPGDRVSARAVDAADPIALQNSLSGVGLLLVCAPLTLLAGQIARSALAAGVDYLDIYYPQRVVPVMQAFAPEIEASGRCFIYQAGFHPGLLAALVRRVAPRFERLDSVRIGLAMNETHIGSAESAREIVEGIADYEAFVFEKDRWKNAGTADMQTLDFGPGFGRRTCFPLWFEELRNLPKQFGIKQLGTYVAGFNWFVDYLVTPLGMLLFWLKKGLGLSFLTRLMRWGTKRFSSPPYGVQMLLLAEGEQDGRPQALRLSLRHPDAYYFTAAATMVCLLQYLDGSIRRPGLHMMGWVIDPERVLTDLEKLGIHVEMP